MHFLELLKRSGNSAIIITQNLSETKDVVTNTTFKLFMGIKRKNRRNAKTNLFSIENCARVFKHFETIYFMPTRKTVYRFISLRIAAYLNAVMSKWHYENEFLLGKYKVND